MHPNSIAPSLTGLGFSDLGTHSQHQKIGLVDKKLTLLGSGCGNKLKDAARKIFIKTRFLPKEAERKLAGVASERYKRRTRQCRVPTING